MEETNIEIPERQPAQCYKCAGGQHSRCHGQWDDVFGDFGQVTDPPRKMVCNCEHRLQLKSREEQVQRLLADVFKVRIVNVTRDDVLTFMGQLRRHGFMLVPEETVIR